MYHNCTLCAAAVNIRTWLLLVQPWGEGIVCSVQFTGIQLLRSSALLSENGKCQCSFEVYFIFVFSLTRTPVCHNAWCRRARNSFDCSCVHLVVSALLVNFIRCHLAYFMSLGDNMHKLTLWSTHACNTKHARNSGSGWSCMGLWKSIPKSYASLGDFRSTLPTFVYTWPHALSQSSWPCMCMPYVLDGLAKVWGAGGISVSHYI